MCQQALRSQDMADTLLRSLSWAYSALCHSCASVWVPTLAFRIKSMSSLSVSQGTWQLQVMYSWDWSGWVRWSSHNRETEILITSTTEKPWELKSSQRARKYWSLNPNKTGFLNSQFFLSIDRTDTPLLTTNMLQTSDNLSPAQQSRRLQEVPDDWGPAPQRPFRPLTPSQSSRQSSSLLLSLLS